MAFEGQPAIVLFRVLVMLFITQAAMYITAVRGAEGIRSHLRRRTGHCFIGHRRPLFECATAQAVCSRSTRGYNNYSCSRLWHYGKPETARLVANGLARATPRLRSSIAFKRC
jgi:hypothetical protein